MYGLITTVVLFAAIVYIVLYVVPYGVKRLQQRQLRDRCRHKRALVLSYDDGPTAEVTPALLDLLDEHQAKATFFLLGEKAVAMPELVDRIATDGHEIGCHSAHHRHFGRSLPWQLTRDMQAGYRLLSPWVGSDALYRPPHGKAYLPVILRLLGRGSMPAWWTRDSGDTFSSRPRIDDVLDAVRADKGGVVLLHDHEGLYPGHRDYLLEVTERLIALAKEEGLSIRRMGEVLRPAGD